MRVGFEIVGIPEVNAGIEGGVARMQIAAAKSIAVEMLGLRNYTITEKMHGPTGYDTVQQKSGNLVRSLVSMVEEKGDAVEGVVGFPEGCVAPYARILNLGGTTRAHIIQAKNAKSLAFNMTATTLDAAGFGWGGGMMYRKLVHHPGSNFPQRPMLYDALQEQKEEIVANVKQAMFEEIQ